MSLFDDDVSGEEIVGGEEIIGAMGAIGEELDDVLNAVVSGNSGAAASKLQRLSGKMRQLRSIDPNAVSVVNQGPNRRRYWHAPFPATAIAAGATTNLQMQPQELFRTERAFIDSQIANQFQVTQMFVGQRNQLLVAGEVNGSVFSEVAVRSFLNLDTANVGNTVNFTLRNDGLISNTPRPDLLGTAAI